MDVLWVMLAQLAMLLLWLAYVVIMRNRTRRILDEVDRALASKVEAMNLELWGKKESA